MTDKLISKMWFIYPMDYYLALKRNDVLSNATTWMNLKDMMLSEINKTQRNKYCMMPFI